MDRENKRRKKRNRYTRVGALCLAAAMLAAGNVPASHTLAYAQEVQDAALQEQRLNTWYAQAIESLNGGDYENALLCLNGCLVYCTKQNNPVLYADLYLKKGYCCLMLERYEDAKEALDEALATDPELGNAILLQASVFSESGQLDEAIAALERYIEVSGDASYYETIAALYEAKGETDKAYEVYEKYADATAADEAEAAYLRGMYQMQRANYEEAIAAFDDAAAKDQPTDGTFYNRGLCYMSLGEYEKAIEDFGKSVEAESEAVSGEALYSKASCEMVLLSYEDAVADFTGCVEREIKVADSMINRGICLLLSGNREEALKDFDECVKEGSNADEARFYRSFVYTAQKEYEKAIEDLTACIENGYDLANSYMQRAQVYKEMGDEEAYAADMEAAQKALDSAGTEEEAEEAVTEAEEAVMEAVTE